MQCLSPSLAWLRPTPINKDDPPPRATRPSLCLHRAPSLAHVDTRARISARVCGANPLQMILFVCDARMRSRGRVQCTAAPLAWQISKSDTTEPRLLRGRSRNPTRPPRASCVADLEIRHDRAAPLAWQISKSDTTAPRSCVRHELQSRRCDSSSIPNIFVISMNNAQYTRRADVRHSNIYIHIYIYVYIYMDGNRFPTRGALMHAYDEQPQVAACLCT